MSLTREDLQAIADLFHAEIRELKEDVKVLKEDTKVLKEDVKVLQFDMQTVKQKVISIDMTMENEMRINIMRVAEGHVDLSRNLADVKHDIELVDGKMEINDLFIRHHDSEIKKLKAL